MVEKQSSARVSRGRRPTAMLRVLTTMLCVLTSAALLVAAARKAVTRHSIERTVEALGCPKWLTKSAVLLLIAIEALAALVAIPAGGDLAAFAIVGLAAVFATAGTVAILQGLHIDCACFGTTHPIGLGWRQVATLPGSLVLAGLLVGAGVSGDMWHRTIAVVLCASVPDTMRVVRQTRDAVTDRISVDPDRRYSEVWSTP